MMVIFEFILVIIIYNQIWVEVENTEIVSTDCLSRFVICDFLSYL